MPRSDALSNPGTSKVFLCLVKGISNPKAIADELGISSPPIIQQLRRLQNLGLVKLGTKEGKAQNYDVNWKAFADRFAKEISIVKLSPGDIRVGLAEENQKVDEDIESLKDNKYFQKFVKLYLENFTVTASSKWPTIAEIIDNVGSVMLLLKSFKEERPFDDAEKQDFHDKMVLWYERSTSVQSWMQLHMTDAIRRTLES
jgi:DNA-binding Lrp family transcriptional regulator